MDFYTMDQDQFRAYLLNAVKAYSTDVQVITDEEYDRLEAIFYERFPDDSFFTTHREELPDTSPWEKMAHEYMVGGLKKCQEREEFEEWMKKYPEDIVVEEKLDGISIEMIFQNGSLTNAITRGKNGIGEDIVRNVRKMKGIPTTIKDTRKMNIRGEIFMFRKDFETLIDAGNTFVNPRNTASGIAKRFDGTMSEYLTILSYSILNWEEIGLTTEVEVIDLLKSLGFTTVPTFVCKHDDRITGAKLLYDLYCKGKRDQLEYDIDGLVIKCNELEKYEGDLPVKQIAWKFPHQSKRTVVIDIIHSVEGSRITPVAILQPTFISGVTISKATLHNYPLALASGVGIGSEVEVSRRNDVIPKVEMVFTAGHTKLQIPEFCPECHGKVSFEKNILGEQLQFVCCENEECPAKAQRQIESWLKATETKGIGPETIRLFREHKIIQSLPEFLMIDYDIYDQDILALDGMESKKLKILKREAAKSKNISLPVFLNALNFPGMGIKTITKILESMARNGYRDITISNFFDYVERTKGSDIRDVGEVTLQVLIAERVKKAQLIDDILKHAILLPYNIVNQQASNLLAGISFCFTGELPNLSRTQAEKLVKELGGEVRTSVSSKLTYLVTDDQTSGTSKNKKARELNIPIIGSTQFFGMIGLTPVPVEVYLEEIPKEVKDLSGSSNIFDL